MPKKKTLEEHIYYLHETVKLSLWVVADWKNRHPKEDIIWTIHERTALVNHTTFNPSSLFDYPTFVGSDWPELRLILRDLYESDNDPNSFEKRGYELLKPYIDGRAERDLEAINKENPFEQYNDSWCRYDLKQEGDYLEIHMANTLYPKSFLADKDYFNNKLKEAVLDAEKHGFKGLKTKSWLNDLPIWQNFMPKEWNDSIYDRNWDIEWHLGFWGQFLTANQCFNRRLAEKYRKTGRVPFPMSQAKASVEAFKEKLGI